jgi:hypothetical protein
VGEEATTVQLLTQNCAENRPAVGAATSWHGLHMVTLCAHQVGTGQGSLDLREPTKPHLDFRKKFRNAR